MAANYPDVIPMIAYEDGPKAMDWLSSAFGFKERTRMIDTDGRLSHGEMQAGEGVIMLATPTPDYQAPPMSMPTSGGRSRTARPFSAGLRPVRTESFTAPRTSKVIAGCSWSGPKAPTLPSPASGGGEIDRMSPQAGKGN